MVDNGGNGGFGSSGNGGGGLEWRLAMVWVRMVGVGG